MDLLPLVELSIAPAVKIASLLFLGLYITFSVIVIRQVHLMTETLQVGFEAPVRLASYLHFAFSVSVFLLALFVL